MDRFDTLSKEIFEEADDIIAELPELDDSEEEKVSAAAEEEQDMSKTMINIR